MPPPPAPQLAFVLLLESGIQVVGGKHRCCWGSQPDAANPAPVVAARTGCCEERVSLAATSLILPNMCLLGEANAAFESAADGGRDDPRCLLPPPAPFAAPDPIVPAQLP